MNAKHIRIVRSKHISQKLHALARASMYMPKEKTRVVMRAFVISQFSYCPLIWMFPGKGVNSKINHIHKIALRSEYQDFMSSFTEVLINDDSVSIRQRNLQLLVTEVYRTKMNVIPSGMKETLVEKEIHYNLRVIDSVYPLKPRTAAYLLETISFLRKISGEACHCI